MSEKITAQVGDKQIIIETGKLAKQADGAVTVQLGETIVIVAAVAATKAKEGQDFFPLTVDYREKAAAAGKFPGGYFKREGRPTEKEILTCRLTDRPIRPLFPKGWYNEVQVQTVAVERRRRERSRHFEHHRRERRADGQRHSVGRPARRRARRPHRRQVRRQPHARRTWPRAISTSSMSATKTTS